MSTDDLRERMAALDPAFSQMGGEARHNALERADRAIDLVWNEAIEAVAYKAMKEGPLSYDQLRALRKPEEGG